MTGGAFDPSARVRAHTLFCYRFIVVVVVVTVGKVLLGRYASRMCVFVIIPSTCLGPYGTVAEKV